MSIKLEMGRVRLTVEDVHAWGQRSAPSPGTYIGFQMGTWHVHNAGIPFEKMGIYLGDDPESKVMVIEPLP